MSSVVRMPMTLLLSIIFSGLRQCLARFVAEASKSRSSDPKCSVGASDAYFVSANAINSLRDLANNGNIER